MAPPKTPGTGNDDEQEQRADTWANPDNGSGIPGVDPRLGWRPFAPRHHQHQLRELWLGDGLAGRIVEHPPDEMTRERGKVSLGESFEEAQARLHSQLDEWDVWEKFAQVMKFDRAYGGGALIMVLNDGMPWSAPVDTKRLLRVRALHLATPEELPAVSYYDNESNPQFAKPATYRWYPQSGAISGGRLVHESRVVAFTGIDVDYSRMYQNSGWGDSILARCEERIRDTAAALGGVGVGLQNFSQDVVGLEKLNEILADKQGRKRLNDRVADMRLYRSMLGVLLLGKGDTYERKGIPMGGVADTLEVLFSALAATTGMPVPVLFGYSQAGLGDTGESYRKIWHSWLKGQQSNRLAPALKKLIKLVLLAKEGPTGGVEPPHWEILFNPLEQMSAKEEDERRKVQAEIDSSYIDRQVVSPGDVARSRFSGPTGFSTSTSVDLSAHEPVEFSEVPESGATLSAPAATTASSVEDLNGAQIAAATEIVDRVALKKIPREAGVNQLVEFIKLSPTAAERVMGEVGRSFFVEVELKQSTRVDSAKEYVALLAREVSMGGLTKRTAAKKVAKLYRVSPEQAAAILRAQVGRADARGATNFPRFGDDEVVSLTTSRFRTFDPAYASDLRENWPEVWALGGGALGEIQSQRLHPVARSGGVADTPTEEHGVRLREEWATRSFRNKRLPGVVAMVKWLVVGKLGETEMKRLLEAEKDRVRRRREQR